MLRRMPSNSGKKGEPSPLTAGGGGFGTPTFKPFRTPSFNTPTPTRSSSITGGRKRKRISYKEDGQADDKENDKDNHAGSDSDDDVRGRKKKNSSYTMGNKEYGADGVLGDMGRLCNREFPVFAVKNKELVFSTG
jgi:DNA repair and recombination RAD54-like protein